MQAAIVVERKLKKVFEKHQATVLAEVITDAYSELVKTSDFNELKGIVKQLAEAQNRTEARVEQLVEAQNRTEARVEQLAEAQNRTEARVEQLAEAQNRTEKELRELVGEHKKTRTQLGGLSATVGYRLEDEAFKALPQLLKRDFGVIVQGRLKRQYVKDNKGEEIEVNIVGEAVRDSRKVVIVGESKSQLSKNDVNRFIKKKLKRLEGLFKEIFPVLVTYMISEPDVERYVKDKGIALYYSYDF